MEKGLIKIFISFYLCGTLINLITGCTTATKPNMSVIDRSYTTDKRIKNDINFIRLKELLFIITLDNAALAYELGKLPEFQDSITNQEIRALEDLLKVLDGYPQKFSYAFNQMNQIGLPHIRRFNSPLQALFWLFLDGHKDEAKSIVLDYALKDLLRSAWLLKHTKHLNRWKWRTEEAKKLFNSCVDNDIRKKIIVFYENNKGATDYIIALSEQHPNSFLYKFKPFENELIKQNYRWDDLEEVVGRINSPELIHYYIMAEYSYGVENYRDPKLIFRFKSGSPDSIARFGEYLLKKAGNKTFVKRVKIIGSVCAAEHTGSGIVLENGSLLLVIDFPKGKSIVGPLDEETLINVLSQGHCLHPNERFYNIPEDDDTIIIDPFANTI
jgi:hypothetical protein